MKYILDDKADIIHFDRYIEYIKTVRDSLPEHIYLFASNPAYFNLTSHSSLHDAWLENLIIQETASGDRHEFRGLEIKLSLLGPYHDRRIVLHYTGVKQYRCHAKAVSENLAHGDVFTHEIQFVADGIFSHEILFQEGGTILIECTNIVHSEEIISEQSGPHLG